MTEDDGEREEAIEAEEVFEKKQRRTAKQQQRDIDDAYRDVMKTGPGRVVMWDILSSLGIYETPLVVGAQDLTYVNIGRQNAGIQLMVRLSNLAPDDYLLMQKENSK